MKLESQGQTKGNLPLDATAQGSISPVRNRREGGIDIWRGVAILIMMATHAIAFFHVGDNQLLKTIGLFGGTVSFTMFLFLAGASAYFSFIKYDKDHRVEIAEKRTRLIYRAFGLLIGYYIVAIVASIPLYSFPPNASWSENLANTLLFIKIPDFTEFILPFVILTLLVIPFRRVFKFLANYPLLLILTGIGLYALGVILYSSTAIEPLTTYKSLLVGELDWHRFPIFQYMLVYLLGISFGRFLTRFPVAAYRKKITLLLIIVLGVLLILARISDPYLSQLNLNWLGLETRWPPSLPFIIAGLLAGYVIFYIILTLNNLKAFGFVQTILHYMGVKAFDFFTFHTILLYLYKYLTNDTHHESPIIVILFYLILVIITFLLVVVKEGIVESIKAESGDDVGLRWLLSEKLVVGMVWVGLILISGMAIYQQRVSASEINPDDVAFKKKLIREENWPFWWDHGYNYFQQIFINVNSAVPAFKNSWYQFNINHAELVSQNRSLASGADVRIVYYDDNAGGFIELPFIFEGINSTSTIKFKLQADIKPGEANDKYFIYYGNTQATSYPAAQDRPLTTETAGLTLGQLNQHKLSGATNRRWLLKEGTVSLQSRTLQYTVTLTSELAEDSIVTYSIDGSSLRGRMDNLGNRTYKADIRISDLPIGAYRIQATAREPRDSISLVSSGYSTFFVTYPLYVTWTQDWEGRNVQDSWMAGLDELARRYQVPMTHFFSPRIYVTTEVDRQRADAMTAFVLNRARNFQDEIGVHLHMWYDQSQAAGVTPRYTPYANWLYPNGGGVPTYAYTKDEMKKILEWTRRIFQEKGLPTPISFRAGGWLIEEHTIMALQETGFLIESSGRTAPNNARQQAFPPPWNLTETQRPYRMNSQDQNNTTNPDMTIWEFPNNGADSYWYTAQELIHRFDVNYPNKGGILDQPQVLTYLSHPEFFYIYDKDRMEQVFTYISNYTYKDDRGPVVYTTLENAYYAWDRN